MAENDIYNNKSKYKSFIKKIPKLKNKSIRRKYHCKNKANIKYFHKLKDNFEINDISYIRRLRYMSVID